MKILFVAMPESIHFARWISQLGEQGWDLHLFPSTLANVVNSELKYATVYYPFYARQPDCDSTVKMKGIHVYIPFVGHKLNLKTYVVRRRFASLIQMIFSHISPQKRAKRLAKLIQRLKPDIIHSIEFQHGAYLVLEARKIMGEENFPTWIATNYGSDVQLFGRLKAHQEKVKAILAAIDYYDCECERDILLAQHFGFKGKTTTVLPNAGGFRFDEILPIRETATRPSQRRQIILKGYQHFAGRALFGLRAISHCADILQGYRILVYSAFPEVEIAAELCAQETGLQIEIFPPSKHADLLREFGQSRIYIGLSISDAASTSLLEAMTMGTFPIQSNTACVDEWIVEGETGISVPPEDVTSIATALRRAILDDKLVDNAAERNLKVCMERLDYRYIRNKAIQIYLTVYKETHK